MERIALFLPNWVGDVVMATPAVRAVRDHFPDAESAGRVQALRCWTLLPTLRGCRT